MDVVRRIRDWWRGWTVADLDSARVKLDGPEAKRLDGLIRLTKLEMNALHDRPLRPVPARDPLDELCWEYEQMPAGYEPPMAEIMDRSKNRWNFAGVPGRRHWARKKYAHATWD